MQTDRLNNGRMILNYDNINVIEFKEGVDRFEIYFNYRPKMKSESFKIHLDFTTKQEMNTYFDKKGFYPLGDYYVNAKNISIALDGDLNDLTKKITVQIFFQNSAPLEITLPRDNWTSFKNYRLV